jgi:hypothetical protein
MRRHGPALGILGGPSAIGTAALGTDQADNIDAITTYMTSLATQVKTTAARAKQDEYKAWIDTVGWYNKNYDRPTYDHARNLRNEFNVANAVTPEEKQAVQQVLTTGLTTEEQQGGGRRVSSEGKFSEQAAPPVPMPSWVKWAVAAGVGVGVLYALGKVTTLAQIFASKKSDGSHTPNMRHRRARR